MTSASAPAPDFGWEPKTRDELAAWFRAAISLVRELTLSTSHTARKLDQLWHGVSVRCGCRREFDDLERMARELAAQDGWSDGWIAIRRTIRFGVDHMLPELAQRLRRLEAELRPRDLIQKIHAYVLSRTYHLLDIADAETDDDNNSGHQKHGRK